MEKSVEQANEAGRDRNPSSVTPKMNARPCGRRRLEKVFVLWRRMSIVCSICAVCLVKADNRKGMNVGTIGCFTCYSFNNSNPGCQDPFSPVNNDYTPECKQIKEDRVGLFPAHYCIKMNGVAVDDGVEVMIRTCALKSMHNQCGTFEFEERQYRGCLTTCHKNGCNRGDGLKASLTWAGQVLLHLGVLAVATAKV